ncbi:MAG: histidinol-phosphatase [Victivallales bacterium]|nr:histidinol-phosphatase [Victivallales bacterium]
MENIQVNLHCHTERCRHAEGKVRDYCQKAVEQGLKILGISDHSPFPDNRLSSIKMQYSELEGYRQEIEDARAEFPELTILAGLEVDYDDDYPLDFYQREFKERLDLDYMITGVHYVRDASGNAVFASHSSLASMEIIHKFIDKTLFLLKSGIFEFMAHPDMVAVSIDRWKPEIEELFSKVIQTSIDCKMPLEINAYGLRKPMYDYPEGRRHPYPWRPFWELAAKSGIPCVISSDAHKPVDVCGNMPDVFSFANELGIPCINAAIAERIIQRRKQ